MLYLIDLCILFLTFFLIDSIPSEILTSGTLRIVVGAVIFLLVEFIFTQATIKQQTVTITDKAQQIKKTIFGTRQINIIKTQDNQIFEIKNDGWLQWYATQLVKKIVVGKTYKIKTYRTLGCRILNVLSATPVKSSVRRKTGKKSK